MLSYSRTTIKREMAITLGYTWERMNFNSSSDDIIKPTYSYREGKSHFIIKNNVNRERYMFSKQLFKSEVNVIESDHFGLFIRPKPNMFKDIITVGKFVNNKIVPQMIIFRSVEENGEHDTIFFEEESVIKLSYFGHKIVTASSISEVLKTKNRTSKKIFFVPSFESGTKKEEKGSEIDASIQKYVIQQIKPHHVQHVINAQTGMFEERYTFSLQEIEDLVKEVAKRVREHDNDHKLST